MPIVVKNWKFLLSWGGFTSEPQLLPKYIKNFTHLSRKMKIFIEKFVAFSIIYKLLPKFWKLPQISWLWSIVKKILSRPQKKWLAKLFEDPFNRIILHRLLLLYLLLIHLANHLRWIKKASFNVGRCGRGSAWEVRDAKALE